MGLLTREDFNAMSIDDLMDQYDSVSGKLILGRVSDAHYAENANLLRREIKYRLAKGEVAQKELDEAKTCKKRCIDPMKVIRQPKCR